MNYDAEQKFDVEKINEYVNVYLRSGYTDEYQFQELIDYLTDGTLSTKGLSDEALVYVNSYILNTKDPKYMIEAEKNVVTATLHQILSAPVNMLSSNRGVDMDKPKAAAKKSTKSWKAMQYSMDSYSTLPLMKEEESAGRDVIGIAAVGLKVFYAISHTQNQKVRSLEKEYNPNGDVTLEALLDNNPDLAEKLYDEFEKLASPKTVDLTDENGNPHEIRTNLTANINLFDTPLMNQVYDLFLRREKEYHPDARVLDVRTMDDASLVFSSLVSSATDFQ